MTTILGLKTKEGIILASDTLHKITYTEKENERYERKERKEYERKIFEIPGPYLVAVSGSLIYLVKDFLKTIGEECKKDRKFLLERLRSGAQSDEFPELECMYKKIACDYSIGPLRIAKILDGRNIESYVFHFIFASSIGTDQGTLFYVNGSIREIQTWVTEGSGSENIKGLIEKAYNVDMSLEDATKLAKRAIFLADEIDENSDGFDIWQLTNKGIQNIESDPNLKKQN